MKTPTAISCRVEGCEHAPFNSTLAERMHFGRVHSGRIKPKVEAVVKFNDESRTAVAVEAPPKVDRRRREWRAANPGMARPTGYQGVLLAQKERRRTSRLSSRKLAVRASVSQSIQVNYCPQCGCHINAVAMGIAVAAQMKG